MIKKIKYYFLLIWQIILLIAIIIVISNVDLSLYLLRQGKGQFLVIYNTQPLEDVVSSNLLDSNQARKIKLIQEVKYFAEQQFGLKKTNNYSTYYDQHHQPILWMLTACAPFSFDEKYWQFPLLGKVSYKGFFNYNLAQEEAIPLKLKGFDVDIGKVSAWSTLGILSDPILSSMLEDDEGALAELIIHELTHATVYFKSSVDFNENFASFVGRQGALLFIASKYGQQSKQMHQYLKDLKDEDILKEFILKQKVQLAESYKHMPNNLPLIQKMKLKHDKITSIINQLYQLNIYNWPTKLRIARKIRISGNAYFMAFNRYDAKYDELLKSFQHQNSNLKLFIEHAKLQQQ